MVRPLAILLCAAAAAAGCGEPGEPAPPPPAPVSDGGTVALATDAAPFVDAPVDAFGSLPPAVALPPPAPCPKVVPRPPAPIDRMALRPAAWSSLAAWADDAHADALPPFLASCRRLAELPDDAWVGLDRRFGRARQWRRACAAAEAVTPGDHAAARRFFETETAPWEVAGKQGPVGKMTAYYVQPLRASRTQHGPYQHPIYRRPPEIVMVDMAQCSPTGRGRKTWGIVDPATGKLVPGPSRKEIREGAWAGRGLELLWVDDPVDVLFLHIQGSGRATLDDGTELWIEYDGKNGQAYAGPAKLLRAVGELPRGQGTMQGIRAWFHAHPDRFDEIVDGNASMVFFKVGAHAAAIGSQGVGLTPQRSVAVDRNFIAASTPLWIDTTRRNPNGPGMIPYRRVMIAQDTGGNIKGAVRADLYWGPTAADGETAGRFGGAGRYWALLPRGVRPRR